MKSEIVGHWEGTVRPIVERLQSPKIAGDNLKLEIDSSYAWEIGRSIEVLAQLIDAQDAQIKAEKELRKTIWTLVLAIILFSAFVIITT